MSVLDAIGNTSLVPLRRVVPAGCGEVHVKLEWESPTGSLHLPHPRCRRLRAGSRDLRGVYSPLGPRRAT